MVGLTSFQGMVSIELCGNGGVHLLFKVWCLLSFADMVGLPHFKVWAHVLSIHFKLCGNDGASATRILLPSTGGHLSCLG